MAKQKAKPLAVVMSDLHLGEETSVLHYGENFGAGAHPLVNELKAQILANVPNGNVPFLIMAGDTLDFSLASVRDAIADFRRFLKDIHNLFDNLVYIPGNHDHHMWRTLQEQVFVVNRIKGDSKKEIGEFPQEQVGVIENGKIDLRKVDQDKQLGGKTFLKDLLPEGAKDKNFAMTYPNIFMKFDEKAKKNILITHGHFFEVAWTLVSDVFDRSLGLTMMNYKLLEQINSPLTEFGWYGLGQAGRLSRFVEDLYKEVKNSKEGKLSLALNDLRDYLDDLWTSEPKRKRGFLAGVRTFFSERAADVKEGASDMALDEITQLLKYLIMSQIEEHKTPTGGASLRHCPNILAEKEKEKEKETAEKIRTYVSYSLGRPYEFRPHQLIFGHTHVPINNGSIKLPVDGRSCDIAVFNTGGWVVDSDEPLEIVRSRPMPFLIYDDGTVKEIKIPWPYDDDQIGGKKGLDIIRAIQEVQF